MFKSQIAISKGEIFKSVLKSDFLEFSFTISKGVAAPSDPVGSILVEILDSVEGGDVEQVCSNLETNLSCLRLLSLSLTSLYLAC